jgi:hypothetical protein
MSYSPTKSASTTTVAAIIAAAVSLSALAVLAQDGGGVKIRVNNVGYEKTGVKRAVVQSSSDISDTKSYILNAQGVVVDSVNLERQSTVDGWSGRNFKVADFSGFDRVGEGYKLRVGTVTSPAFSIGEKVLQAKTGADQVGFFNGMRSVDPRDRALPIFGGNLTRDIYGGWWDANGDPGKHISHLSYANYFNPQQIPLVAWALLHAIEVQPDVFGNSAKAEAAWGADYLLRALSPDGYFYMSVFDNWGDEYLYVVQPSGSKAGREICSWGYDFAQAVNGVRSGNYQCAMREGAGVSIAALARAYKAGISGDSSAARYLAGAERAYKHLEENPVKYQDDGKENIIDDYCGLLAASELYNATGKEEYRADAQTRVTKLLARQSPEEGWFYSGTDDDNKNTRPFYHAADEGLPVVALSRYYEVTGVIGAEKRKLRDAVRKNLLWYNKITYKSSNPFEYVKMYRDAGSSGGGVAGTDLARGKTATASRTEGSYAASNAFDGNSSTRWSSYQSGVSNDSQCLAVDLGKQYKVNKVILNWEAAYGKDYRIETSENGTDWALAHAVTGNSGAGIKTHAFTPVNARHVRMYGIAIGNTSGGFSLFDFEVYGEEADGGVAQSPYREKFFVPHDNETGYWWQGENARIASLASAFILGARLADSAGTLWKDTLFNMASAQFDWILGKNPFGICMMAGYEYGEENSYPPYPAGKNAVVKGGICNGITAKRGNQDDIEWKPYTGTSTPWEDWRWIEQWLPHNAWYLVAVSSLSHRIDHPLEPDEPDIVSVKGVAASKSAKLKISAVSKMGIKITLPFNADDKTVVSVYNMRGKKVFTHNFPKGVRNTSMKLPSVAAKGTYIVNVKDGSGKNRAFGKLIFR